MSDAISKNDSSPSGILFLSDAGHKVINRYGILNLGSRDLPHPATYVIDKGGIVRWKEVNVDYRVRPTNQQILAALKNLH
jgi:peroxiredoxin